MSPLRKLLRFFGKRSTGNTACFLLNLDHTLQSAPGGGRMFYDAGRDLYYINFSEDQRKFYCYHPYSLALRVRKRNVMERLTALGEEYSLDTFDVADGDVVIDVGANIGEVGMYYALVKERHVDYYAFEPMKKERQCCELNNPNGKIHRQALWKENGRITFYQERGGRDDSSLIEPAHYDSVVEVETLTLESFVEQQGIDKIKVLKLEAEGAEPEVLMGAQGVLDRIQYIAADLGSERGRDMAYTVPDVANLLYSNGFKMTGMHHKRANNYLFRNTRFD